MRGWCGSPRLPVRVGGGSHVGFALLTAEELVSAPIGNAGEVGDIHMDHRSRVRVLVGAK